MTTSDLSRFVLNSFDVQFGTVSFQATLNSFELPGKSILDWVLKAAVSAVKEIVKSMDVNDSDMNFALKIFQFLTGEGLALHELEAKQIGRVLRAYLGVYTDAMKDGRIPKIFFNLFWKRDSRVTLRNGSRLV